MGAMVIGALRVDLGLETSAFEKGSQKAQKEAAALAKRMQDVGGKFQSIGKNMTLGITLPLAAMAAQAVKGAQEQRQAMAQVEAGLKSMGNASGKTAEELAKTADAMELNSLYAADEILTKVSAQLLTFGNISGEVFDRTQQAAIDMAQRMGGDIQGAAMLLGKALNDPIKGAGKLSKAGVQLTDSQKAQIKTFTELGQVAKAQGIILGEVEKQFKGSAKAAADTSPIHKAQVAWEQMMDKIGEAILPVLPVIANAIASVAEAFTALDPAMATTIVIIGGVVAAIGPLLAGIGFLVSGASALAPLFVTGGALAGGMAGLAALMGPLAIAVAAVAAAWALFGDKLGPVLSELKTMATEVLGPPLIELFETVKGALVDLWTGPFGDMLKVVIDALGDFAAVSLKTFGSNLINVVKVAVQAITLALGTVIDIFKLVAAILTGDWSAAWDAAGRIVSRVVTALGAIIEAVFPGAIDTVKNLYHGVKNWLQDKLGAVFDWVMNKVKAVGNAFYDMYDAVVGHSYVPDMVDGIAAQMARLDAVMVAPTTKATEKTAAVFKALAAEVQPILDRLFPDEARLRAYQKEMEILEKAGKMGEAKGGISAASADVAKSRLWSEYFEDRYGKIEVLGADGKSGDGPLDIDFDALQTQMERTVGILNTGLAKPTKKLTAEVVESFGDMALGVMDSLNYMVDAISNGNIFDKIVGVLNLIESIVGVVMQVKGINSTGSSSSNAGAASKAGAKSYGGGRAYGGPVVPGKSYRVGERGPEYFTPGTSGYVTPDKGGSRGNTYQISGNLLTEEFWAQIQSMDDVASQKGALAGANMVQETSAKRGRQRLGRGR